MSERAEPGPNSPPPAHNGPVHVTANILKVVVASAAEAEIAATFVNAQEAVAIRNTLKEMGWPQGTTQLTTDNECAEGFACETMKQKRTKAMDMRFYWVRCRCRQKQFLVTWRSGETNKADFVTKHHSPEHNQAMRPIYLHCPPCK